MSYAFAVADHRCMADRDRLARLRDEQHRLEFAVLKEAREMDAVERALERRLKQFEHDELETKRSIEAEWRREHQGHEPERPPRWRARS
jgi:hypothetical protein